MAGTYMALLEELTKAWEYGGVEGAKAVELLEREIQAAVEVRVAERCAPLVEAASRVVGWIGANLTADMAQDYDADMLALCEALAAYRAAQGEGREG
jgi:hypothetical protein